MFELDEGYSYASNSYAMLGQKNVCKKKKKIILHCTKNEVFH